MNWFGFILAQCLNALSQASILFFIACGLTLIFGIMRIVNFAHGVIFMLGAWAFVLGLTFWAFWKLMRTPQEEKLPPPGSIP